MSQSENLIHGTCHVCLLWLKPSHDVVNHPKYELHFFKHTAMRLYIDLIGKHVYDEINLIGKNSFLIKE